MKKRYIIEKDGSALLLVLWAISIISFAVMGVIQIVNLSASEVVTYNLSDSAQLLAESGIAVGSHPDVFPGDRVLRQEFENGDFFEVTSLNEASKLQINYFLEKDKKEVVTNLFRFWGLSSMDADIVYDCLADWVDENDDRRLNGAEFYNYYSKNLKVYPKNQKFLSIDEMDSVLNINLLSRHKSDWKDYFTVWTDGKVDVNSVSAEVLAAVAGISLKDAKSFIERREVLRKSAIKRGVLPFSSIQEAASIIEMPTEMLTVKESFRSVKSIGHAGNAKKTIQVVVSINRQPLGYIMWREGQAS